MKGICQHCEELIVGNAYRVTSEDEDVTLLNMVVCVAFPRGCQLFHALDSTGAQRTRLSYIIQSSKT
jgi:hypothetical protein